MTSKAYSLFATAYLIKAQSLPESVEQMETLMRFWWESLSGDWTSTEK